LRSNPLRIYEGGDEDKIKNNHEDEEGGEIKNKKIKTRKERTNTREYIWRESKCGTGEKADLELDNSLSCVAYSNRCTHHSSG
jgi:hypothetical protein